MEKVAEFFVPGTVRTAGSKSAYRDNFGKVHLTHAGKYTKGWMDSVKWFALKLYGERRVLLTCPVKLTLRFFMARAQGHFRTGRHAGELKESAPAYPTKKPDLDKLNRAVGDALTGIIYKDDSQVVKLESSKVYCKPEDKMGVFITIESL
jgi:Holliday junction resolvase RusA-like endonuclease